MLFNDYVACQKRKSKLKRKLIWGERVRLKSRIRRLAKDLRSKENEDVLYLQQQLLLEFGVPIAVLDDEDFTALVEVMSAKAKEDRPVSAREAYIRMKY